jgi:anthranilate/para-aminobenzoate synthase component I
LEYDKQQQKLTAAVGGAITIQSDPSEEYEECLVKMNRLLQLFDGN